MLQVERENEQYIIANDFYAAKAKVEKQYRKEEEERAEAEFQARLQEEKDKWDREHKSFLEEVVQDLSRDDKRQTRIEEERNL